MAKFTILINDELCEILTDLNEIFATNYSKYISRALEFDLNNIGWISRKELKGLLSEYEKDFTYEYNWRVSITVSDSIAEDLRMLSTEANVSINSIVRCCVDRYFSHFTREYHVEYLTKDEIKHLLEIQDIPNEYNYMDPEDY